MNRVLRELILTEEEKNGRIQSMAQWGAQYGTDQVQSSRKYFLGN